MSVLRAPPATYSLSPPSFLVPNSRSVTTPVRMYQVEPVKNHQQSTQGSGCSTLRMHQVLLHQVSPALWLTMLRSDLLPVHLLLNLNICQINRESVVSPAYRGWSICALLSLPTKDLCNIACPARFWSPSTLSEYMCLPELMTLSLLAAPLEAKKHKIARVKMGSNLAN